ncbi:MAG: glycosyltransferase family 1 protein [Nannocystis sp.]|nr:glycosyltransferase family 1 protein [Nannocystis sp.]
MSRVLIQMLREPGHLLPTIKLARALAERGHEVLYLLTPDWRGFAERHRLAAHVHLADVYPPGCEAAWPRMSPAARQADAAARVDRRNKDYLGGALARTYRELAPDLVLGDVYDVSAAIVARALGIPHALLSPSLHQGREPAVPPLTSSLPLGDEAVAGAAWAELVASGRAPWAEPWYPPYVEAMLRAHGLPPDVIAWTGAIAPVFPGVPQLVLCPAALEVPRRLPPRIYYDIPSIDAAPSPLPPELTQALGDGPLILGAFGSQGLWRPDYRRLCDALLALARARPRLTFVLAVGEAWAAEYATRAPPNAHVLAWAPQRALLARAAALVSVGGLGTMKEAIWHRVPVIVAPALGAPDAPGNAARVAYHGLGEVLLELDPERLAAALDRALAGAHAAALAAMQRAFAAAEAGERGACVIEALLAGAAELP